ncbi:MAG: cob(I)yrinic acid a,c-diamide adenosyltransferase [Candidatus Thermoplasmatota archaeon]|nr:cob(I)yrinic acid a,c-diamide adenosyltransferase [Candidatus Thermoplasmatota archaeon]
MFNRCSPLEDEKRSGIVQVYTGTGKGKTTAALGLALRAAGHDQKGMIIQFMKGQIKYGELSSIEDLPGLEIEQYGRADFVDKNDPDQVDIDFAKEGFDRAKEVLSEEEYDIVVLDEMNMVLDFELLEEKDVIEMLENKPPHMEIVLTGRNAPPSIIDLADLVTVMSEVKHPYMIGMDGREGIEF